MKKTMFVLSVLAISVLALSFASPAMAAESFQGGPGNGDAERLGLKGNHHQGEFGTGTGVPANQNLELKQNIAMDGLLEDTIHENLAIELGITPVEMADRLAAGESVYEIAISLGFDAGSFREIMILARIDALTQAVDLGLLTQEQADWMASRGFGTAMNVGTGDCAGQD
jgi:hypothetical protein